MHTVVRIEELDEGVGGIVDGSQGQWGVALVGGVEPVARVARVPVVPVMARAGQGQESVGGVAYAAQVHGPASDVV